MLTLASLAQAEDPLGPKGKYGGGNETVLYSRVIRAVSIRVTVADITGAPIPGARIQVQIPGKDSLLIDLRADEQGRYQLIGLPRGVYRLGISSPGFNLHVWKLRLVRLGWKRRLIAKLHVGT